MADITKCRGTNCKDKQTCYRFTAEPNPYRQSYFMNVPGHDRTCNNYWQVSS